MKVTVKCEELKEAVKLAASCASNDKMYVITSFLGIITDGNAIWFTATDLTNTVWTKVNGELGDAGLSYVIECATFKRLIEKTNCDTVTFDFGDNSIIVDGNGTYTFPYISDESGYVSMPMPNMSKEEKGKLYTAAIKNIISINGASAAKNLEVPCYRGYYISPERVITTNGDTICFNNTNVISELSDSILLDPNTVRLLGAAYGDECNFAVTSDSKLSFSGNGYILQSHELFGKDIYPIDSIEEFLCDGLNRCVEVNTDMLKSAVDRLELFVEPYDRNSIRISFAKDKLVLTNAKESSIETIGYVSSDNFESYSVSVDVGILKSEVDSIRSSTVMIYYGDNTSIKLKYDNVLIVIALVEE